MIGNGTETGRHCLSQPLHHRKTPALLAIHVITCLRLLLERAQHIPVMHDPPGSAANGSTSAAALDAEEGAAKGSNAADCAGGRDAAECMEAVGADEAKGSNAA